MNEYQKKAFDFAADLTKQLITLSTGIITLTVTFSKDVFGAASSAELGWLVATWVLFFLSIVFGLLTLMALTGNLDPVSKKIKTESGKEVEAKEVPIVTITSSNVRGTSIAQILTFLVALITMGVYGFYALSSPPPTKTDAMPVHCCTKMDANVSHQ